MEVDSFSKKLFISGSSLYGILSAVLFCLVIGGMDISTAEISSHFYLKIKAIVGIQKIPNTINM